MLINRLKLIFLCLFALISTGALAYHLIVVWPRDRCEAGGKWWDTEGRVCAQPVQISDITGRTVYDKRAEAWVKAESAKKAPAPAPATKP